MSLKINLKPPRAWACSLLYDPFDVKGKYLPNLSGETRVYKDIKTGFPYKGFLILANSVVLKRITIIVHNRIVDFRLRVISVCYCIQSVY